MADKPILLPAAGVSHSPDFRSPVARVRHHPCGECVGACRGHEPRDARDAAGTAPLPGAPVIEPFDLRATDPGGSRTSGPGWVAASTTVPSQVRTFCSAHNIENCACLELSKEIPPSLPPNDYHLTLPEERAEIASLRSQLAAARVAARVLAHSYDHDSNPPPWALEEARKWDAYGREAAPDREALGRCVRAAWIRWAQTQPDPKPSWLVPWEELSESHKEADRQMGEAVVEAVKGGRGA